MNGIDWALSGPPTTAAWPGYDNDSFCDAPGQENTYHETQLALQIGYLDFLYEFYGMATGVRTAPIGLVGNNKDLYQKTNIFLNLHESYSLVVPK